MSIFKCHFGYPAVSFQGCKETIEIKKPTAPRPINLGQSSPPPKNTKRMIFFARKAPSKNTY